MEVCPKQRNHTFGSQIWKRSLGFARRHRQPLCRWVQEAQEQGAPAWALRSLSPPSTHGNNQHFFLVTGNMTGKRLAGSVHLLLVICIRLVFSPWCAKWRVNGCFTPGNLRSEDVVTLPGSLGKGQRWELKRVCVCVPVYFGVLLLQCHALPYIWSDRAESWLLECQAKQTFIYCVLATVWTSSIHPKHPPNAPLWVMQKECAGTTAHDRAVRCLLSTWHRACWTLPPLPHHVLFPGAHIVLISPE